MDEKAQRDELIRQRPGAVETFIRTHQDRVVNTCYAFLHNRADAEDAAQQVFLKAWQALPEFRGDSTFSSWLYKIAVRTSLDILRRRKREIQWCRVLCFFGLREEVQPFSTKDPLVELESRERARLLMEAIDDLPDQQKIAYTLASFEKLKGEEIAQVMETTLSAVESLLHRARANLREKLRTYHQVAAKPQNPKEGRRVGPPGSGQKPQDSMRDGPSGPLPDPGGAGGSLAEIPKTITGTGLPERTKEKEAGDG